MSCQIPSWSQVRTCLLRKISRVKFSKYSSSCQVKLLLTSIQMQSSCRTASTTQRSSLDKESSFTKSFCSSLKLNATQMTLVTRQHPLLAHRRQTSSPKHSLILDSAKSHQVSFQNRNLPLYQLSQYRGRV